MRWFLNLMREKKSMTSARKTVVSVSCDDQCLSHFLGHVLSDSLTSHCLVSLIVYTIFEMHEITHTIISRFSCFTIVICHVCEERDFENKSVELCR